MRHAPTLHSQMLNDKEQGLENIDAPTSMASP